MNKKSTIVLRKQEQKKIAYFMVAEAIERKVWEIKRITSIAASSKEVHSILFGKSI